MGIVVVWCGCKIDLGGKIGGQMALLVSWDDVVSLFLIKLQIVRC